MEESTSDQHLPKTDSIDELAQFWDTHAVSDFEADLEEVNEIIFERERTVWEKTDEYE
jgi:hypothetical protein